MLAELVSGALGLALYLNTLGADFCYDDRDPQQTRIPDPPTRHPQQECQDGPRHPSRRPKADKGTPARGAPGAPGLLQVLACFPGACQRVKFPGGNRGDLEMFNECLKRREEERREGLGVSGCSRKHVE